ncbi:MAG: mechanosensitive ion channel [Verrucomicrobiota bacterium]
MRNDGYIMAGLAEGTTVWLTNLVNYLERSTMLQTRVHGQWTWMDMVVVSGILVVVVAANAGLTALLRRAATVEGPASGSVPWHHRLVNVIGKPMRFLLWIYGLYFAAAAILVQLAHPNETHPLLRLGEWFVNVALFICVIWLFTRLTYVLEARLARWTSQSNTRFDDLLVPFIGKSLRVVVPVLAVILALPVVGLPPAYSNIVSKASSILIVLAITYVLFQSVAAAEKLLLTEYDITKTDNLRARKVYTQVHVLSKALHVVIAIFCAASILMLFEEVRRLGTSILASAGVVGIIIGFAAQRTIANLFAGFQLAVTQPIRIDDVVIVEGEWGRIEEITLTYVVVKIWDQRRMIVPLSYFIEKPFQNWTRVSADLLGAVMIYVDYTFPVEELRKEAKRIVEGSPFWDRKFWNLQVTDTTERAMQVRVLVTASDSGKAWDLRCELREKLLAFVQSNYPQSLPKVRAEQKGFEGNGRTATLAT